MLLKWKFKFLVPRYFIHKYSDSSLKIFESKVVHKAKAELTNVTHDISKLLTTIFQE